MKVKRYYWLEFHDIEAVNLEVQSTSFVNDVSVEAGCYYFDKELKTCFPSWLLFGIFIDSR